LTEWFEPIADKVKQVFLVHGEEESSNDLAEFWATQTNAKISVPQSGQKAELG